MASSRSSCYTSTRKSSDNWELSVVAAVSISTRALESAGFELLTIAEPLQFRLQSAYRAAQEFFGLSLDAKMATRLPKDMGYRPFAGEYSTTPDRPDQIESFSASYRIASPLHAVPSNSARHLYLELLRVIDKFIPIAEECIGSLAVRFSPHLNPQEFVGALRRWSILQVNYALPSLTCAEEINTSHEDGCALTIMSNTAPGLEIRLSDGTFSPICIRDNEILAFPGEILWLLSGGYLRPLYHRVKAIPAGGPRMALLFFADIDPRLCQPWLTNDINREVNVAERVLQNSTRFGLAGWTYD